MKQEKLTTKPRKRARAIFLFIISLLSVLVAFTIAVVGCNYVENQNFKETFYCVSSLKVHNKIRIVQLSDLHSSYYGAENAKLLDRVTKLNPDIILLTGDCIDSNSIDDAGTVTLCAKLTDIAPTYYIYGNNEVEKYYYGALTQETLDKKFGFTDETRQPSKLLDMTDALAEKLKKAGVKVLKNSFDTITIGTTNVDIYGVLTSNPSAFWSYAGDSFDEFIYSNGNNLKITAIHEPTVFEEYAPDSWGDLMLAGHTHGGHARLPIVGPVYTHEGGMLPAKTGHYVYGRYDVQGRPLIISSGLENKSFFRINNPPEIVVVDVNKF